MSTKVKAITCCDNQRLVVDESFSYECEFIDDVLSITVNDYCSDGFENLHCTNCYEQFKLNDYKLEY